MRKKRTAIPVQPPKVPFGTYVSPPEIPIMYQKLKSEPRKMSTLEKGTADSSTKFEYNLISFFLASEKMDKHFR